MREEIRGFSLLQPWASLMAFGAKKVETRSWRTPYRGLVAIAASAKWDTPDLEWAHEDPDLIAVWTAHGITKLKELPLGKIIALGRLVNCRPTVDVAPHISDQERGLGNYEIGRWAWMFEGIVPLIEPVPVKGSLGLYKLPDDVEDRVIADVTAEKR